MDLQIPRLGPITVREDVVAAQGWSHDALAVMCGLVAPQVVVVAEVLPWVASGKLFAYLASLASDEHNVLLGSPLPILSRTWPLTAKDPEWVADAAFLSPEVVVAAILVFRSRRGTLQALRDELANTPRAPESITLI